MVGTNPSSKLKNPIDSTLSDRLDFLDQFVPEIEDFSLPVNSSSLLDFDSITDWIDEMENCEAEKFSETVTTDGGCAPTVGPSVEENFSLEKLPKEDIELQQIQETPTNEHNQSPLNCITGEGNLQTVKIKEEVVTVDDFGECLKKEREGFMNFAVEGDAEKLLSLNSLVEEELGKVTLVDEVKFNPFDQSSRKDNAVGDEVDEAETDESSASESESRSSSDSSSSSSSEDEDDAVVEGKKDLGMDGICKVKEEPEEGEITETDAHMIASRHNEDHRKDSFSKGGASGEIIMDDDDEDVLVGPIKSKNELKVLPPVPPVDVTLQPSHQMLPVGIVNSKLGAQVIVEGGEKHDPLSEGSILWITETKSPLGRVDEIFGPVKNPYYIVRYNSEKEVPKGIHEGSLVSYVPEFVDHVINNKNLYQKGYDASGNDDEEVDVAEFSDDEQEAEYRRMIKMSKRGNKGDMKPGGYKKSNNSLIRNDACSNNSNLAPVRCNNNVQNQQFQSPIRVSPPPNQNIPPGFGPPLIAGFPQQGQPSGFRPNSGRMPFQMQNQDGYQMPWIQQQQQQQHPMMNMRPPFQQGFPPNSSIPPLAPGSMVPNQVPISFELQAQLAQLSMLSGMLFGGQQGGPPTLPQNPPQFNEGAAAPFQARAPTPFQGRGGRFPGRGGRRGGRGRSNRSR